MNTTNSPYRCEQKLQRLADLSARDYEALDGVAKGNLNSHPSTRLQLEKDGLLEVASVITQGLFGDLPGSLKYQLTAFGLLVLDRARMIVGNAWSYQSLVPKKDIMLLQQTSNIAITNRFKKHLGFPNMDVTNVKLMVGLAKSPESYRWLCRTYGHWSLSKVIDLGFVEGSKQRGSLWTIKREGALALAEIAAILRKEKKKQR